MNLQWGKGPLEPSPRHRDKHFKCNLLFGRNTVWLLKQPALISLMLVVVFSRNGSRKWAPHPVEVEAILQNNTKISHKICFPNETEEVRTCFPGLDHFPSHDVFNQEQVSRYSVFLLVPLLCVTEVLLSHRHLMWEQIPKSGLCVRTSLPNYSWAPGKASASLSRLQTR